jgi:hypothetical protein
MWVYIHANTHTEAGLGGQGEGERRGDCLVVKGKRSNVRRGSRGAIIFRRVTMIFHVTSTQDMYCRGNAFFILSVVKKKHE